MVADQHEHRQTADEMAVLEPRLGGRWSETRIFKRGSSA
jgi:hypothetical protein